MGEEEKEDKRLTQMRAMSSGKAVAILVETVETATPYVCSIELVGEHDAREVLEALRVVLNDLRERDNREGKFEGLIHPQ